MKIVRKLKQRAREVLGAWSVAGASCVWPIALLPHVGTKKSLERRQTAKLHTIMQVLERKYASLIAGFVPSACQEAEGEQAGAAPVWVFWHQGLASMPPVCRFCYASICRNSSGHPVRLVTAENMERYVRFPDSIMEKVKTGKITRTHLSDILRMALLAEHGGLWLDATVYVSRPIGEETFRKPLFTLPTRIRNVGNISHSRWTGFILGGKPGGDLFRFGRDFLFGYWRREERLIDYFLIDFVIALACEHVPAVAAGIDALPTTHRRICDMQGLLNKKYDEEAFRELTNSQTFHKLSYKNPLVPVTEQGDTTLYGYLLQSLSASPET